MTTHLSLPEALEAISLGHKVRTSAGSIFWLEHDEKNRPVLMIKPFSLATPVKHAVVSSEHFTEKWELVQ